MRGPCNVEVHMSFEAACAQECSHRDQIRFCWRASCRHKATKSRCFRRPRRRSPLRAPCSPREQHRQRARLPLRWRSMRRRTTQLWPMRSARRNVGFGHPANAPDRGWTAPSLHHASALRHCSSPCTAAVRSGPPPGRCRTIDFASRDPASAHSNASAVVASERREHVEPCLLCARAPVIVHGCLLWRRPRTEQRHPVLKDALAQNASVYAHTFIADSCSATASHGNARGDRRIVRAVGRGRSCCRSRERLRRGTWRGRSKARRDLIVSPFSWKRRNCHVPRPNVAADIPLNTTAPTRLAVGERRWKRAAI